MAKLWHKSIRYCKANATCGTHFLSGSVNSEGIILKCGSTTNNPNFNLQISNASTTSSTNTSYTIDWGDGSPLVTTPTFTTLSPLFMV
ncbi:MAG: hypothetical protein R2728_09405 [Chitinophagales bacterium]